MKDANDLLMVSDGHDPLKHAVATSQPMSLHHEPLKKVSRPNLMRLSDVESKMIEWLWQDKVPMGNLTLIVGDPGLGKSTLVADLVARVTRGSTAPEDIGTVKQGSVIMLSSEDDVASTIKPRIVAAGGATGRVHILTSVRRDEPDDFFSLEKDIQALRDAVALLPDCVLIVIDPVSAYLGGTDSHRNASVRALLAPLAALAAERNIAVVLISHLSKENGTSAMYRTNGSIAFVAAVRAAWVVAADKADPSRRLLLNTKSTYLGRNPAWLTT